MSRKTFSFNTHDLIKKYLNNIPINQIMSEFNISNFILNRIIKENGIAIRERAIRTLPTDKIIALYKSGKSSTDIAKNFNVSRRIIIRLLTNNSIQIRTKTEQLMCDTNVILANINKTHQDIINLFNSGIGVRGIHEKFGISIKAVKFILQQNSIDTRNRSEQQFARMAITSQEKRQQLVSKAHIARRGQKTTTDILTKKAVSIQRTKANSSKFEYILMEMLKQRGIECVHQKAIGCYNCDIAIDSIAVEIHGGNWHRYGRHLARHQKRTRELLNAGWHVLIIPISSISPLTDAVADYIASYVEFVRSDPTLPCEYRVIWRGGKFETRGSLDDDYFSLEPPFKCSRDSTTGQYISVPK